MKNDKDIKELLNKLTDATTEPVPHTLAEDIKRQIPSSFPHHKMRKDTINIIIHLRISKLAAAAAIIITIIICGTFLGGRDSSNGVIQDGMLFIKHWARAGYTDISAIKSRYDRLLDRGEDVVWYGEQITSKDRSTVLIQRKLPDGNYEIMFADGREKQVTAEELIPILSRMLQKKAK
ncbi:MAG: hypothetical protein JW837_15395 [Sedimentisphaerales bacterium]|nr:hypothetical protein [Sedimentisphaerales bacterium]